MGIKRKAAKAGVRVAPKAAKLAGKTAWKTGKAQARLVRHAVSSKEPVSARIFKYGIFALAGFAFGALVGRFSKNGGVSSSSTSTAAGSFHQRPEDQNRTGAERDYSDPSKGPLIGKRHDSGAGDVPEQREEVENRIRTRIGNDPRTMSLPRVNVEVNDGVAELRGVAPSDQVKDAAGEVAANVAGVREVRNLLTVG